MSSDDTFRVNFITMIKIIAKSAHQSGKCPIEKAILDLIINIVSGSNSLKTRFRDNITKLRDQYRNSNTPFDALVKKRDRSVFNNMDLFPNDLRRDYNDYIQWFSDYLVNDMPDKTLHCIWKFIDRLISSI